MDDWIDALLECRRRSEAAVLVTVASARGSVPREPGARMVVTARNQYGTIGGGNLELQAGDLARRQILGGGASGLRRFPLGATLGQCCGGLVDLAFHTVAPNTAADWLDAVDGARRRGEACVVVASTEPKDAPDIMVVSAQDVIGSLGAVDRDAAARVVALEMLATGSATRLENITGDVPAALFTLVRQPELDIVLFGAGHVGQALAKILADLPCRVLWVDERAERLPSPLPRNLRAEVTDAPLAEVDAARPGACFLVMTHSHPLDQALAEAILRRGDFCYFGLIGSIAKRRRFERRMAARGVPAEAFARMTCPIGIEGIEGKAPAVIAVAVAAQLLQVRRETAIACRCGPRPSSSSSHPSRRTR